MPDEQKESPVEIALDRLDFCQYLTNRLIPKHVETDAQKAWDDVMYLIRAATELKLAIEERYTPNENERRMHQWRLDDLTN